MEGLTLLREAMAAGLEVRTEAGTLVIRGPRAAENVALQLLAHKTAVIPLLTWEEELATELLRETLRRTGALYHKGWAAQFEVNRDQWLEVETRIEAAAMVRDMPELVRALIEYEDFTRLTFQRWAEGPSA